jgi:hypothetical protein
MLRRGPARGPIRAYSLESLSRKRVLNPAKNIVRDSPGRIAGCFAVMATTFKISGEKVHVALTVALLAACAANLVLVCSWL